MLATVIVLVVASADKVWVAVVLFRESVLVGYTSMTPQHVQQAVQEMGEQYKGNAYHLLQRNCNHFSNDLCRKLTGKEAPLWVSHSFELTLSFAEYACPTQLHLKTPMPTQHSSFLMQINRLAGMAVMLHCLIPTAWVPPLSPPTASPVLGKPHVAWHGTTCCCCCSTHASWHHGMPCTELITLWHGNA